MEPENSGFIISGLPLQGLAVFDDIRRVPVNTSHRMINARVGELIPHGDQLGFRADRTGDIAILDIQPCRCAFTADRIRLGGCIGPKLALHDLLASWTIGAVITGLGTIVTVGATFEFVVIANLEFRAFPI